MIRQPGNGAVAHVEQSADVDQGLTGLAPRTSFGDLMRGELGLPAEPYPTRPGSLDPFTGSREDQASLELREAGEDCHHQPTMWGGGVGPGIGEGSERCARCADCGEGVQKVPSAPSEPVQACYDQAVSRTKGCDCPRQCPPISHHAADLLTEYPLRTRGFEGCELSV